MLRKSFLILSLLLILTGFSTAQQEQIEVGIDEQLGAFLPMDAEFVNSYGDTVNLGQVINKPTLLALVYYECPGICSPLLTELAWVAGKIDLVPNEDFKILTLSFDHRETSELSSKWKKNYLAGMKEPFPKDAWSFLTGDSVTIKKVTDAVGFRFKPVNEDYTHAGALIAISPKGKISRYVFGLTYNQFDLKMALIDAESGKTNPTIAKVLQYCFSYDPEGRRYSLNITRIIGTFTLLGVGLFLSILIFKKKKKV